MKNIMVVSPSKSMEILSDETISLAEQRLIDKGFSVQYAKNVCKSDCDYHCASIQDRVEDLQETFSNSDVDIILTTIGGYNVNQILPFLDYELIRKNPKVICGFSDITALLNAIYTKTGIVTYYGPHFSSFGMKKGFEYTEHYFDKVVLSKDVVEIEPSLDYSNDPWYLDQETRMFIENKGLICINEGMAEGIIVGGNLCTFQLLQGTEYMPSLKDKLLFLEDTGLSEENFLLEFDRHLESIIQNKDFAGVRGIVIGREERNANMNIDKWKKLIRNKEKLTNIPVIINADFGHTTPIFTFPIGGRCEIISKENACKIILKER